MTLESDSRRLTPGDGTLKELMRERIRATIETLIDEELGAALGAGRSRVGSIRAGYQHGKVGIAWPARFGQLRESINRQLIR